MWEIRYFDLFSYIGKFSAKNKAEVRRKEEGGNQFLSKR